MSLRDSWKKAGVGIGHAAKDLGKAFADTAKTSIRKANEWANSDDDTEAKARSSQADIIDAEVVSSDRE